MSAHTKAVRGNPQPPVRIKFEHYLTPSYTEAGTSYHQNVREMTCDCPHWQRHNERGTPIVCKHLQNALVAAHFEAIEIAREQTSSNLASLAMKYHQHIHIKNACLFVLWERERDYGPGQAGFAEFVDKINQLEGEIKEIVEERQSVTFSQSIATDLCGTPGCGQRRAKGSLTLRCNDCLENTLLGSRTDPRLTAVEDQIEAVARAIDDWTKNDNEDVSILNDLCERLDRLQGRKKFLANAGDLSHLGQGPRTEAGAATLEATP